VLRIISGIYRGIPIEEVPSESTRPTTDRNKETLFNILGQYFDGGMALDLFAGSGALGLEALSRGIEQTIFIDNQILAIQTIEKNAQKLRGLSPTQYIILKQDVIQYLKTEIHQKFDYIFCDPPYAFDIYEPILEMIANNQWLASNGVLVFESDKNKSIPSQMGTLVCVRKANSGNSTFHFYMWEETI